MIAEPIEIFLKDGDTGYDNAVDINREPDIFLIRHDGYPYLGLIRSVKNSVSSDVRWSIFGQNSNKTFFVRGDTVNKERFIDFVSANYPDHFEWILFHPEWLN